MRRPRTARRTQRSSRAGTRCGTWPDDLDELDVRIRYALQADSRRTSSGEVLEVPGVVHVREVMTGEENRHVVAVGADGDGIPSR